MQQQQDGAVAFVQIVNTPAVTQIEPVRGEGVKHGVHLETAGRAGLRMCKVGHRRLIWMILVI